MLRYNVDGNSNTATGSEALASNTSGAENTAVGTFALVGDVSGSKNIAIGSTRGFNTFLTNTQPFRPYPNYGSITFRTNGARSNYHAGTIKLDKRFSHGLSFLTFYTYSNGIDSSSNNDPSPGTRTGRKAATTAPTSTPEV